MFRSSSGAREKSNWLQPLLNLILALSLFGFRRVVLSLTDLFPLEEAMLISGLWVQSMNDMFVALAYPYVVNPLPTFGYIYLIQFVTNAANLLFVTDTWFKIRYC